MTATAPRMRAAVCTGPGRIELEERPVPEPAAGEVRLRISACGICGSDLHLLPMGYLAPCIVPGHEMAGVVDAVGPGVSGLREGDGVAVEPLRSCGSCRYCASGRDVLCPRLRILGIHESGGFAEYAVIPARRAYPVPPDLPAAIAALAEPMAVVVHGLRRGGVEAGSQVLVLGAGTIGALACLAARAAGAEAWVTARYPHQAELARSLGAKRVLGEAEGSAEALAALGAEHPFDCVLESVGGEADTLGLALAAVAPGGIVSVLGLFTRPVRLEPMALLVKEVTLAWSNCYDRTRPETDFARAIALLDAHRDDLSRVATHPVPLAEIEQAFALAGDRSSGAVKVTAIP